MPTYFTLIIYFDLKVLVIVIVGLARNISRQRDTVDGLGKKKLLCHKEIITTYFNKWRNY